MNLYARIINAISLAMSWVGLSVITAMMLLTCADVVLRYFGYPIRGAYDITRVLGSAVFALPLAYSHIKGYQVAVGSVFNRTPRFFRVIVDTLVAFASMTITALVAWRAVYLGYDLYVKGRVTDTIPIPLWPFVYLMVLAFAVYCLLLLSELLKMWKRGGAVR